MEAIHRLAANNPHVQHDVLELGAERLLMQLLKKRNAESLQEKTAMALWALAGDDINEKREMANGIGVQTLIEFVNSMSENLHLIGSEGLGVLAQVSRLKGVVVVVVLFLVFCCSQPTDFYDVPC